MGVRITTLQAVLTQLKPRIATVITVDTTKTSVGSTASDHFKLPLDVAGAYSFHVDWGDSTVDVITAWNAAAVDHTYAAPGTYTVTITGTCFGWAFANTGDRLKITDVLTWGTSLRPAPVNNNFRGCGNLTNITATDVLDLTGCTSLQNCFRECAGLVSIPGLDLFQSSGITDWYGFVNQCPLFNDAGISDLDVSGGQNFGAMFYTDTAFNRPLAGWDVSNATSMRSMFYGCASFNQPLNAWDVSNVTDMMELFQSATVFNQPLDGWDVSKVTKFLWTFRSAAAFNQDITRWNVEAATSLYGMFQLATSFKQNVGAWWPRNADMTNMFLSADMNVGGSPTNVVLSPQDYSNVNWTKTNATASANVAVAPDGTSTADALVPSVTNSTDHSAKQTRTVTNGASYTVRVAVKARELTWAQLICTGAITANVYANLSTGAIESSSGTVSVTDIGSGWYVLSITGTTSSTSLVVQLKAWNNASGTTFAGNASDAVLAWQASAYTGGSLTNYNNFLRDLTGWTGGGAGAANRTGVTTASVASGGSGYTVGDVLTVVGGTLGVGTEAAQVTVATTDLAGSVLTVTLKRGCGNYATQPANAATTTGGTGVGCTLTLTWSTKFSGLPASAAFHGGNAKYDMLDLLALNARKQLITSIGSGGKGWTITDGGPI